MDPTHVRSRLVLLASLLLLSFSAAAEPIVAAAANLRIALDELHATYRATTGRTLKITYGSSGNLVRQIERGAPFELFFSADEAFVERLAAKGLTRDEGALYGIGRIVVFSPEGSVLVPDPRLDNLRRLLDEPGNWQFAIANPEHAPYGRAAVQALESLGLWSSVEPRIVRGENVAQAAQFAISGNSAGGIIAYSLVLTPDLGKRGRFALIPSGLHEPLRQRMVLLKDASPEAVAFYSYVQEPAAQVILERYGFEPPPSGLDEPDIAKPASGSPVSTGAESPAP